MANYKVLATWDISIQNLYKDITLIQQGITCKLNISLRSISRVIVNYKVGNEYVTDLCTIDLDNNKVIVPFKKNVLEVGTHALELVCHMKNGDVLPTPNYSYSVTKSLTNDNDITEEDAYPVLIGMIQELTKNEAVLQANEEARANAEMYRELNEDERQNAEAERKANENTRISNENTRQSNESNRQQYETQRRVEEDERLTDEQVRVNAENIRIANENERLRKEIERQNAEELRQIAYNSSLYGRMDEAEDRLDEVDSQLAYKVNKENMYYVNLNDYKEYTTRYKCKDGTTKTDWGVAINQALSDCIGELIIPYGTYYSSLPIETVNPIKITGMGINASFIKLMPGVELSTDYFFKINRHYTTLQHLNIQGSLTEYDTATITGLELSNCNHLTIENVKVQNFTGDGINIYQPSYDTHLNHVLSWGNQGNGYVLEATDLFLSKCIACEVGEHGFVIKKGNNQLNQCKAYFTGHTGKTGTGDGFYIRTDEAGNIASHTTRLLSCEAQETGRHGFYLYNSNSIQLIACQADSGSVHTENSYGYFMKNLKQSNISGVVTNKEFLKGHFKYGSLISGCSGTSIDIKTECVDYYDKYGVEPSKYFVKEVDIDGINMSNNIIINNNNVQPNLFKNEYLILDEDGDGLSDYMVDGGSTGGIEYSLTINRYNQAQELKVTNTSTSSIDKNCKIYTEGRVKNASNFAFSVTTKTSNSKLVPFVRINFYDSSNELLEQFADYLNAGKYKLLCLNNQSWYTFNLTVTIPDNAIKFKIELGLILKEVGANGSVFYKNLKYIYR